MLYPREAPRGACPGSERRVWEALRATLPERWTAWHSLRARDNENVVRECDFVVAAPEFGLLVIEVKGGRVSVRDGTWVQDGRALERSPLTQGTSAAHAVKAQLARLGGPCPPFGAVVLLPDIDFSEAPRAGDAADVVLGRQDLAFLDQAIRDAAARAVPRRHVPSPELWIPAVHRLWGEQWVPTLSTCDTAEVANRRSLRLNDEQLHLVEFTMGTPRAVVTGAAGTGKTLMARELCHRRQRQGQRVIYVCFTKALAAAIRRDFPSDPESGFPVRAVNIRALATDLLRQANRTFDFNRPGAWDELGLEAAQAAEDLGLEPFDLVVVDEALDLSDADWLLVEAMSRGRHLWAFADPRQHFWRERSLPASLFSGAAIFDLPAQHRSPRAIEQFASLYARDDAAPLIADTASEPADEPEGVVRAIRAPDDGLHESVAAEIRAWRKSGVRPEDIAVVTLAGLEKTGIVGRQDLCDERIATAESEDASTCVVADTFVRFKGFERPFVIVTELGSVNTRSEYDTRMYIALTRATATVTIVGTADELAQDSRLLALTQRASAG